MPPRRAENLEKNTKKTIGAGLFNAYSDVMFVLRRIVTALFLVCLLAAGTAVAGDAKNAAREVLDPVKKAMTDVIAAEAQLTAEPVESSAEPSDPADNQNAGPQLPVPRFVTLATDEVNVRVGPGTNYPIKFIIRRGGLPVEVTKEHEIWRKIKDAEGDEGWVHKAMLSGRRAVIIQGQVQPLLKKPVETASPVAKLEPGVIAELEACKPDWCSLKVATYDGWIKRAAVWGVYPDEIFKE